MTLTERIESSHWNVRKYSPGNSGSEARLKSARAKYAAKSLFWKILRISPCGSRFCTEHREYALPNLNKIKILENQPKKKLRDSDPSLCCATAASLTLPPRVIRISSHLSWGLL